MYNFLAVLSGIILAVMIQMNGGLSSQYGAYHAAFYIHMVGSIFAIILLCIKKRSFRLIENVKDTKAFMYLGGAIGVLTTVFNNVAFSHISVTSILALELFSQLVFSYLIDRFGLFGMAKQTQKNLNLPGVLLCLIGIFLMMGNPTAGGFLYILLSLGSGITVVLSRIVNAHLSNYIGALEGSLVNHLTGLPICFLLAMAVTEQGTSAPFRPFIWCGGILGVTMVAIYNIVVPKIPAYRLSLFTFCGQLFCSIFLDILISGTLNTKEFGCGLLVSAGIAINELSVFFRKKASK